MRQHRVRIAVVPLVLVALTACGDDRAGIASGAPQSAAARATKVAPPKPLVTASRGATRRPALRRVARQPAKRPSAPTVATTPPATPRPVAPRAHTEIALPAHDGSAALTDLGRGVLTGDARLGCVWVLQDGRRTAAVWPPGYRARFGPVRVYDERGREVWREGRVASIGGGGSVDLAAIPAACRTGERALRVLSVDRA